MNATVVIPTYWAGDDARANAPGVYDHSTKLNATNPELDRCLASLEQGARHSEDYPFGGLSHLGHG